MLLPIGQAGGDLPAQLEIFPPGYLQQEHPRWDVHRHEGGQGGVDSAELFLPDSVAASISDVRFQAIPCGKEAIFPLFAHQKQLFRPLVGQRVILPRGDAVLMGVAVPQVAGARLVRQPAKLPIGQHMAPPQRQQAAVHFQVKPVLRPVPFGRFSALWDGLTGIARSLRRLGPTPLLRAVQDQVGVG